MKIFLDESKCREQLFPFTHIRHVADIRIGILTIREKWEKLTGEVIYTEIEDKDANYLKISANIIPTFKNYKTILGRNSGITAGIDATEIKSIEYPWNIFQYNDWAIRQDFEILTRYKIFRPISQTNTCIGEDQIYLEDGVIMEHSIINAMDGPVYIGRNAVVMEGNLIRGPFALGESAVLKMGSKIYGGTSIGPYCVAGGEIKNSIMFGYSNKAHDGYLGDSVIGEWCNLGAGTSNSNVKNTGGIVKYDTGQGDPMIPAGNKGGLLMGDYSRAAINTSFNTATIVGICCNIFGSEYPEKFVPDFSWGKDRYDFKKAINDIDNWKKMKGSGITENERTLLEQLYQSNH